jgi:PAS domain S-box-containing protein
VSTTTRQPESGNATDGWLRPGVAVAFLLAVAIVDIASRSDVRLTGLFVIPPLGLAASRTPRHVLPIAVLAVLCALGSGLWDHFFLSLDHCIRMVGVGVGSSLGVLAARARAETDSARHSAEAASGRAGALASQLRVTQERLDRTLGALAEAVTVHDGRGKTIYVNEAAVRLLGRDSVADVLSAEPGDLAKRFDIYDEHGARVSAEDMPGRKLVLGEAAEPLLTRSVVRETGQEYWLLTKATLAEDPDGGVLAVNVIEDVTEAKELEIRQRFLNEAGEILASSLDHDETLQAVAELAVPKLADWCGVEMLERDGSTREVAVAHVDPEKIEFARRLRTLYPPDPDSETGVPGVIRSGRAELYAEIPEELIAESAQDAEHLALIMELTMRSVMIVPMVVGDRTIGAMTFVAAETVGNYDEDDLAFAAGVARRAAVAVENSRLYTEQLKVAETLQKSLLPSRLPEVPGWSAAAVYRSGDKTTEVGGDFYDLFPVYDGLVVVLGDITGKGVAAATLTAFARHTAKTAALLGMVPGSILQLINEALRGEPQLSLLTAVCAHFAERDGEVTVTVASGGHPLPIVLRKGSAPKPIGRYGTILGAPFAPEWEERTETLAPGDIVLFYTDGVTDTPGETDRFGDRRLLDFLATAPQDPEQLVSAIDRELRDYQAGTVTDDTALLALQLAPARVVA